MQYPLPNGTLLQHRYRLTGVLGQGGFGRTYLAEDQGRFNEPCVLKEFTPQQTGVEALRKAKELFQKEAEILYRLKHPQVPDFRATFEQDQRLFLVEQYIQGKTYQELLDDRVAQGFVFSEREGLQLLEQMLGVLNYLHERQIIHRDISPDNMICRESDGLPVLIDFGAVKELATQLSRSSVQTRIGKDYYAAPEQILLGKAVRSSDLYSLAVTIIVLLTGQEPERLYDSEARAWRWQEWIRVTPKFAEILDRMLRYEQMERYQSTAEIIPLLPPVGMLPVVIANPPANSTAAQLTVNVVGRSPTSIATTSSHSSWSKLLIGTGHILGRGGRQLARGLWGVIRWTASMAVMLFGAVFRELLKWAIVLLVIVSLVRWGWSSLVQQSREWLPQPKIEVPQVELPKIEFPPVKLPNLELPKIELPNIELPKIDPTLPGLPSLSNVQRRENLQRRLNELNIDSRCLVQQVDDRFYATHPELVTDNQRVALSDDAKDEELRSEWFDIAERFLNDPPAYNQCQITS